MIGMLLSHEIKKKYVLYMCSGLMKYHNLLFFFFFLYDVSLKFFFSCHT
jgi:hypothetical protein